MLSSRNMSVKFGLLGILASQAQHGYELGRSFERLTGGSWKLNHGQIYQSLEALAADGLVSYTVQQEPSAPERKVYSITREGRRALDEWLATPEARVRPLRDELFVRMGVMALIGGRPEETLALLAAYRKHYTRHMRELTRAKDRLGAPAGADDDQATAVERLLLDAAIYHCDADLRWLERCEAVLAEARRRSAS